MRILVPILLAFSGIVPTANASAIPDAGRQFFETDAPVDGASSAHISVAEFWQMLPSEIDSELQELSDEVTREFDLAMIPTGKPQTDWKTKGIDLIAHIETLPGGLDSNALHTMGTVPSLQFFGKIPVNILADWDVIQIGSKAVMPAHASAGTFVVISPNHVAFAADTDVRMGNALCAKEMIEKAADHMVVYRYSYTPFDLDNEASLDAESEAVVMFNLVGALGAPEICTVFIRKDDGNLVELSYTPGGRPLGKLDDDADRLTIVSSFDLYQQLNSHYKGLFAEDGAEPAEDEGAVDDPL